MTETKAIRILIADDHAIVRDGIRKLLELQPAFVVVGEAPDGVEAVRLATELKPDVLLLDLAMPRMNGLEVLAQLESTANERKAVLLTAALDRESTIEALKLGARGVILKESATEMLYKCIHAVMRGEYWIGRERIADVMETLRKIQQPPKQDSSPASRLTQREIQIIAAIVEGASNKDAGNQFGVSEQTIKNHLSHIFDKLGVSNRLELALYAIHHQLLSPERQRANGARPANPGPSRRTT